MTSFRLTHTHTHTRHLRSARFFILRVTDSPATCSRWMASLSGFPFRLTPLMARTRSPMWMAPVLRGGEREREGHKTYPSAPDRADSPVRRPPFDHLFVFKCGLPTSRRHVALSTRAASPPPRIPSPLCEAFPGEARNDDGVEGLLRAGDGDAQRSVVALQLHRVDNGARHLQLICKHTGRTGCIGQTTQGYRRLWT